MPAVQRLLIEIPARARSREVASFFAQLDDQSRRMFEDLADAKPAELAWQPRPGRNTIGMLLAHCAIVEAFWLVIATHEGPPPEWERLTQRALRFDPEGDGMPLAAGGRAPRGLQGWTLARHRKLHDRARVFAKRTAARWSDEDLSVRFRRRSRRTPAQRLLNPRWVLYHVLEHQAGHYGQMLLLRHEYRDRRKAAR